MIQDIYPHNLYNQYQPDAAAEADDYALFFDGPKLLVKDGAEGLDFPKVADFGMDKAYTYLFAVDEMRFFLCTDAEPIPEGCRYTDVFALRRQGNMPQHLAFAAMTGKHLADWYRDTQFCGRCGAKRTHSQTERAMVCPECKNTAYPRIMPAVIVGVRNGNQLLLTKYRVGNGNNALIAGFTEIGETLEQTVAREVMEEAGIKVKNIRYYKSQPWGVANDVLMGYYCDVDGDTQIHMDSNELKMARWVERNEIELQPDNFSLTNEMMMKFKNGEM